MSWVDRTACRGQDTRRWVPPADEPYDTAALAICAVCPVWASCLLFALDWDEAGLWGGVPETERNRRPYDYRRLAHAQVEAKA